MLCTASAGTATYPLSLHDALPISRRDAAGCGEMAHRSRDVTSASTGAGEPVVAVEGGDDVERDLLGARHRAFAEDRKSTRLNSSHSSISYAVFCLKKKSKVQGMLP